MTKKINFFILNLILCIYTISLVFPPLAVLLPNSVWFVLILLWLFLSFAMLPSFYRKLNAYVIIIIFIYIYVAISPRIQGNGMISNRYIAMPLLFFGTVIYDFYKETGRIKDLRNILIVVTIFSFLTVVTTTMALIENPYISRSIKSSGEYSQNLAAMGIGGYSFIYYCVMQFPICLHLFLNSKKSSIKLLFFMLLLMDIFLVIKSSYMIALLVAFIAGFAYAICYLKDSKHYVMKIIILLIFTGMLITISLLFYKILPFFPPRIQQIFSNNSQSLVKNIFLEFVVDRYPQMYESINSAVHSPLLGIALTTKLKTVSGFLVGFGQHSFALDTLALFGFLAGALIIWVSLLPFLGKKRSRTLSDKQRPLYIAMYIGSIVLFFINNMTDSIALAVSLFYMYTKDIYV